MSDHDDINFLLGAAHRHEQDLARIEKELGGHDLALARQEERLSLAVEKTLDKMDKANERLKLEIKEIVNGRIRELDNKYKLLAWAVTLILGLAIGNLFAPKIVGDGRPWNPPASTTNNRGGFP